MTSNRSNVIDFSHAIGHDQTNLIYKRSNRFDLTITAFTSMFSPLLWLTTLAMVIILALTYLTFNTNEEPLSIWSALALISLTFIQRSYPIELNQISSKILFSMTCFLAFVLYATYTAALTSVMTLTPSAESVTSFQDILDRGMHLYVWKGSIDEQTLAKQESGSSVKVNF